MEDFSISILDLLLVILTGLFGFRSLFKGIIRSIFSLLGICASYLVASLYYRFVTEELIGFLNNPQWVNLTSFSLLFIAVLIVFMLIDTMLLQHFTRNSPLKDLGGLLAFVIGLLEGFLFCSAILWVLYNRDLPNVKTIFQNSIFTPYYLNFNPLLFGLENRLNLGLFP